MGMQEVTGGTPIKMDEVRDQLKLVKSNARLKIVDGRVKSADLLDKVLASPPEVTAKAMELLKKLKPQEDKLVESDQKLIAEVAVKIGLISPKLLENTLDRNVVDQQTKRFENLLPNLVHGIFEKVTPAEDKISPDNMKQLNELIRKLPRQAEDPGADVGRKDVTNREFLLLRTFANNALQNKNPPDLQKVIAQAKKCLDDETLSDTTRDAIKQFKNEVFPDKPPLPPRPQKTQQKPPS